jgi:hypothetical protein
MVTRKQKRDKNWHNTTNPLCCVSDHTYPCEKKGTLPFYEQSTLSFGLALVGKDIVFRFIIEYSSLRDFYKPLGNNNRSIFLI